ncbi:RecF/RecN/SMC protein [Fragilariopsis cylindrus CCMP1102]|uniref:Structural maintenance of chromosomes protein n=1 Tax=Fragilariopsis cylindrus CCMP1102 TaxID=635003 RepID=A0A1E7EUQ4_9STRA|nr:RecF/RecN/SMC protein [Fragilariopsis cylindrus CCMP1102]|eukprot:OEU09587.1 RecF/RecN/SMC protein [Fragilariopsis cylindrus CCMP1102]
MPVTYLELENFKSYGGLQKIGPFQSFTSIIGPNGSGKSNCMDALSFVLGVQSRDLRSTQMKDLIFRPPGMQKNSLGTTKPLQKNNKSSSTKVTTKFQRTIHPNGNGDYRINNKVVTYKQYEDRLASIGVLVKARNFLVFQGDVESLARKSPAEFVELLENISQSAELKQPYDEALTAKEEAEAASLFCYNKQKGMKGERRLLKEQRDEAIRFDELLANKQILLTDYYLWQIYHMEIDRQEREQHLTELKTELEEKEESEQSHTSSLKKAKKEASKARRDHQAADKKRVELAATADHLEPSLIRVEEEIKTFQKQIANDKTQISKHKEKASTHDETLKNLDTDTKQAKSELEELQNEYETTKQDALPDDQPTLTQDQEEEYERVREAATLASVGPRDKLKKITRQMESARASAADAQRQLTETSTQKNELEKTRIEITERREKIANSISKTESDRKSAEDELRSATQDIERAEARRTEIDQELENINAKLRDARDDRRKNRDEERLKDAIKSLQLHFKGGVLGRLVDLCRPTQRRFNLAVTVAAGKDMDGIAVVDTRATAIECIRYLRENRIGSANFLPLDSIQVPSRESTERVRAKLAHDGRFRLAADVISCDPNIRKAVLYAVNNTVVCDTLDVARQLCFGSNNNRQGGADRNETSSIKAVTLGGAVISKAGTMTGGTASFNDASNRAGHWDDQVMEEFRVKKDKLDAERNDLDRSQSTGRQSIGRSSRMEELRNNYDSLNNRAEYSKSDMEFTRKALAEKSTLLKSIARKIPQLEKKLAKFEEEIKELNSNKEKAIADVKAAEDEHLGPFLTATGMTDIQAYEQATRESRDEFNKNKRALVEHITQLEEQKNYESNRDLKKPIATVEKRLKTHQKKLKDAKGRQGELKKEGLSAKENLEEAEETVVAAQEEERRTEEHAKELQNEFKEAQNERNKVRKSVSSEESALEQLRGRLSEILQRARLEEIVLPLAGADGSSGKAGRKTRSGQKVDFTKLRSDLKQILTDRETSQVKKDFEEKRSKYDAEIEGIAPNMKAHEAFSTITEKLKGTDADYQQAKEKSRKAATEFLKIKKRRTKKFLDAFNHIDTALKTIYTDMTKSSKHPLGGNAYLTLDDTEEPFKGGMKFNAMPPMKRFRDMYQLSGGEKTVASLALLFAIHSYHPAPFFVMDEVDAALDNINLRKVCNYIQQRSQVDFQCIVISLKDMFYERSQSLVGICKDVGTNSSRTLTLDLTQFDKKKQEEEEKAMKKKRKAKSEGGSSSKKRQAPPGSPAGTVTTQ